MSNYFKKEQKSNNEGSLKSPRAPIQTTERTMFQSRIVEFSKNLMKSKSDNKIMGPEGEDRPLSDNDDAFLSYDNESNPNLSSKTKNDRSNSNSDGSSK